MLLLLSIAYLAEFKNKRVLLNKASKKTKEDIKMSKNKTCTTNFGKNSSINNRTVLLEKKEKYVPALEVGTKKTYHANLERKDKMAEVRSCKKEEKSKFSFTSEKTENYDKLDPKGTISWSRTNKNVPIRNLRRGNNKFNVKIKVDDEEISENEYVKEINHREKIQTPNQAKEISRSTKEVDSRNFKAEKEKSKKTLEFLGKEREKQIKELEELDIENKELQNKVTKERERLEIIRRKYQELTKIEQNYCENFNDQKKHIEKKESTECKGFDMECAEQKTTRNYSFLC